MVQMKIASKVTGIVDLYDIIAKRLGFDECRYDCTKLEVSEDIQKEIDKQYEDKMAFAMDWVIYGPKVNEELPNRTVAIDTGFIIEDIEEVEQL